MRTEASTSIPNVEWGTQIESKRAIREVHIRRRYVVVVTASMSYSSLL